MINMYIYDRYDKVGKKEEILINVDSGKSLTNYQWWAGPWWNIDLLKYDDDYHMKKFILR